MGVEIATATPGLYPVFGATNEPNLDGFSVVATPASGQPTLVGVTEPQPACAPGTALSTNSAPNLYCETDTDNGFEFPMAASPVTFDFTMGTTPAGYAHDPDQTLPLAVSEPACLGAPKGVDVCELESGPPPTSSDITWFDYIGIYRELTVTVKTSSGTLLPDVHVALACTAPGSDPSYACPPAGEKNNLDSTPIQPADASSSVRASTVGSTSNATTVTGPNGKGSFAGVYLPGSTVSLSVTPPAGYQAASLVSTVPSPVTAATTTGAALSRAAQTPVNLIVVLSKTPPATTTTTVPPTTTTSTTRPAAPTASTLPFTGANARGEAMDAGIAAAAGAGLLLIGRRRKRRGAHFTNSR